MIDMIQGERIGTGRARKLLKKFEKSLLGKFLDKEFEVERTWRS